MEVLELAVRAEIDRGLLNALTSKVLAQHDPSIKSSFVNTGCWDAATSRVQMGNWAQLTDQADQLRKSIIIKAPHVSRALKIALIHMLISLGSSRVKMSCLLPLQQWQASFV